MEETVIRIYVALMVILLMVSCSNDNSVNSSANIGINISPKTMDFNCFSGGPESEHKCFVVKNTNKDSMSISLQTGGSRVHMNPASVRLGPSASESIWVWLDCSKTAVGSFFDTVAVSCSDKPDWVDMVLVRSYVAEGTTYVTTDSSHFIEVYGGYIDGCYLWSINVTWDLVCHSNCGKSVFVSKYAAYGMGTLGERIFAPLVELKPGATLKCSLSFQGCGGPNYTGAYTVQVEVRIDDEVKTFTVTRL
jgi:hypothetical protein